MLSLFLIVPKTLVAQIPHWVYHKYPLSELGDWAVWGG